MRISNRGLVLLFLVSAPVVGFAACNPHMALQRHDTRYIDHQDGTVSDTSTGLMWRQCPEGVASGQNACDDGEPTLFTWQQALLHANAVNGGTAGTPLGYDDWRVPTLRELKTLVDLACFNPAINARVFPATPARIFWSSVPVVAQPALAWGVFFYYGGDSWEKQTASHMLRLVRDGTKAAE